MEKERRTRVVAIVALCIAVMGLSIGFASFTRDLNITFSESNVEVSGDLDIKFLASNDPNDTSTIIRGFGGNATDGIDENLLVFPATISSERATISGLGATFNSKDQAFQYNLYIYNNSEYDAYLKSVDLLNYIGYDTNKVCTAMEGTNQGLVDDACKDMHIAVSLGDETIIDTSTNDFSSVRIPSGETLSCTILIMYAGDVWNENEFNISGSALLPNGDFKINFGDIKFSFSSLEG